MRPVLQGFADGAERVADLLPRLRAEFAITDAEAAELIPSGRVTLLSNRAHWARTYLSKARCLHSPQRNKHLVTAYGRELLQRHPERIDNTVLATSAAFTEWVHGAGSADPAAPAQVTVSAQAGPRAAPAAETPEDRIAAAYDELQAALSADLLEAVLALTPVRFERLILDLLRAMGYGGGVTGMYRQTAASNDGGIDGIIDEDALGLDSVYLQAKRYAPENKIGREALQAFVGSLTGEGASKGVFVTTSDFTRGARDYVSRVQQRIVLVNGDRLTRLMIENEVGVRARHTYVLRSVDEDYFANTD